MKSIYYKKNSRDEALSEDTVGSLNAALPGDIVLPRLSPNITQYDSFFKKCV